MTNIRLKRTEINLDEDSDDSSSDYTPNARPSRRHITQSVRRHSRLLYLEKYGLNQPGWYSSDNLNDYENPSSDEELCEEIEEQRKKIEEYKAQQIVRSPSIVQSPSFAGDSHPLESTEPMEPVSLKRPVSIRNYVKNTTTQKRPARFVKPLNSASTIGKVALPPTEFIQVHKLLEIYEGKIYIEGYLQKKNDLRSNGTSCQVKDWSVWYVELCGPVLSLWDASENSSKEDVSPQYINITDSTVHIEQDSPLYTLSLNSAGANRYILQALNSPELHQWITAIRLSCFECARIQEIYTKAFITRPQYAKSIAVSKKPRPEQTGFLHARFPNATGWKQYWVVITNQKKKKSLFGKKIAPTSGRIMFYESKKAKHPVVTFQQVVQAYTVYPESSKLIHTSTLFKIEGALYKNDSQLLSAHASTLLMAASTHEMVDWLVHVFDSFHLYGLPGPLLSDPHHPKALDFGAPGDDKKLFLDLEEIETHALSSTADFHDMLAHKLGDPLKKTSIATADSTRWDHSPLSPTLASDEDSVVSEERDSPKPHPILTSQSHRWRASSESDRSPGEERKISFSTPRTSHTSTSPIYSPRSSLWPTNHSTTSVYTDFHRTNRSTSESLMGSGSPFYCSTDALQYSGHHPFRSYSPEDIKEDDETPVSPTFSDVLEKVESNATEASRDKKPKEEKSSSLSSFTSDTVIDTRMVRSATNETISSTNKGFGTKSGRRVSSLNLGSWQASFTKLF